MALQGETQSKPTKGSNKLSTTFDTGAQNTRSYWLKRPMEGDQTPVKVIVVGAGSRGHGYASYATHYPNKLKVDPGHMLCTPNFEACGFMKQIHLLLSFWSKPNTCTSCVMTHLHLPCSFGVLLSGCPDAIHVPGPGGSKASVSDS